MNQVNIIHLKQDIGRLQHIKPLQSLTKGSLWDGEYAIKVDKNGYGIKKIKDFTYCAKMAKYKLLKKFYKETNYNYIVIFEDDVIWHKKFEEYWKEINDIVKGMKSWKIVYMGISTYLQQPPRTDKNIELMTLPPGKVYTGAYAFFLHRSTIPFILEKIEDNDILFDPFDVTCLGYLQSKYRDECYLTNPQIIIADVSGSNIRHNRKQDSFSKKINWNPRNFFVPNKIPFFIISCENADRLKKKIKSINRLIPIVNPIIIQTTKYDSYMEKILTEYKSQGIQYHNIKISDSTEHNKILKFLEKYNLATKYFFISTTSIGFPDQLPSYLFDMILNDIQRKSSLDCLSFKLNYCKRCNSTTIPVNLATISPFFLFSVIKTNKLKSIKNIKYIDIGCYLLDTCKEISNNEFHNISRGDIVQYINYHSHMYDLYGVKKINHDYVKLIIEWSMWYFIYEINKMLDNILPNKITKKMNTVVDNKYRKKFNTSEFRLLGISHKYISTCLKLSLDNSTYIHIFGSELFILIKHLSIKYGIELYYIDIELSFN